MTAYMSANNKIITNPYFCCDAENESERRTVDRLGIPSLGVFTGFFVGLAQVGYVVVVAAFASRAALLGAAITAVCEMQVCDSIA